MLENKSESFGAKMETEGQVVERLKKELFDREPASEYKRLAGRASFIEQSTAYAENLREIFYTAGDLNEAGKLLKEKISGKVIVDLACGRTHYLASLSQKLGAKLYVGIDLYPNVSIPWVKVEDNLDNSPPEWMKKRNQGSQESIKVVREVEMKSMKESLDLSEPKYQYKSSEQAFEIQGDMLLALSRFKENSVAAIIASGIEDSGENYEETEEYIKVLENEIEKVLMPGGLCIIYTSDVNPRNLKKLDIETRLGISLKEKS